MSLVLGANLHKKNIRILIKKLYALTRDLGLPVANSDGSISVSSRVVKARLRIFVSRC